MALADEMFAEPHKDFSLVTKRITKKPAVVGLTYDASTRNQSRWVPEVCQLCCEREVFPMAYVFEMLSSGGCAVWRGCGTLEPSSKAVGWVLNIKGLIRLWFQTELSAARSL